MLYAVLVKGVIPIRKFCFVLSLLLAVLPLTVCGALAPPSVSAASAILIEAGSGRVLFEKDADIRRGMASTTKIMTALIALEDPDPTQLVRVSPEAVGIEGSSLYLRVGDAITLKDLVTALMLESANDAAAAIAIHIAGSVEAFAARMNDKAASLGLENTHFDNPHGLDGPDHATTARDLAKLAAHAMKNEAFRTIVSTYRATVTVNGSARTLINHNRLLKLYDGAIGVKTGYTKKCGRCLVSAASRDGVELIAVTLNAPDDWRDHAAMLDFGFESVEAVTLALPGELAQIRPCIGCETGELFITNPEGLTVCLDRGEHAITRRVFINRYLWAPIRAGEVLGRVEFYDHGRFIGSLALTAGEDAPRIPPQKGILEKIFD